MAKRRQLSEQELLWRDIPEHELVRLTKLGNTSAFEELVMRMTDMCLRVANSILRSHEDARDEVQNAFWLAYSRIELFTYDSKFSTWLIRIVINCCFLRLRIGQRRPVFVSRTSKEDDGGYASEGVTRQTPELDLGKQELNQALRRELRGIPPLLRMPIELHYIDELSVKEVARQLGLTVPAVKSRLHRGHIFLRGRMLKHAPRRGTASLVAAD